jgi:hypothetical protein
MKFHQKIRFLGKEVKIAHLQIFISIIVYCFNQKDSQKDFTNALRNKLKQLCPDISLQNSFYEKRYPDEYLSIKSKVCDLG